MLREVVESAQAPIEREAGEEGEREAAEWIAERLRQAGARDATIDEATLPRRLRGDARQARRRRPPPRARSARPRAGRRLGAVAGGGRGGADRRRHLQRAPALAQGRDGRSGRPRTSSPRSATPTPSGRSSSSPTTTPPRRGRSSTRPCSAILSDRFPGIIERIDTSLPQWWGLLAGPLLVAAGGATRPPQSSPALGRLVSASARRSMADIQRGEVVPGANDNLSVGRGDGRARRGLARATRCGACA